MPKEMGTAEQMKRAFEIDSLPRTARRLASYLMKEKPEVNSILYRRSDLFCQDKPQPTRWSLSLPSEEKYETIRRRTNAAKA